MGSMDPAMAAGVRKKWVETKRTTFRCVEEARQNHSRRLPEWEGASKRQSAMPENFVHPSRLSRRHPPMRHGMNPAHYDENLPLRASFRTFYLCTPRRLAPSRASTSVSHFRCLLVFAIVFMEFIVFTITMMRRKKKEKKKHFSRTEKRWGLSS